MIVKHIPMNDAPKSSVLRLVDYVMDRQGKKERYGGHFTSNCTTDDPEMAALEMLAVQEVNIKTSRDTTYHLLMSFPEGEDPDQKKVASMMKEIMAKLGLEGHQYVAVKHQDTDNIHWHFVVNLIHPDTFTIREPYRAYHKLGKIQTVLEKKYGLQHDNHEPTGKTRGERRAKDMEAITGQQSLLSWMRQECLLPLKAAQTWDEFHHILARSNITATLRGNGLVFVHSGNQPCKGSDIDRSFSKSQLEKRLGKFVPSDIAKNVPAEKTYTKEPLTGTAALKEKFGKARDAAKNQRRERLNHIDEEYKRRSKAIIAEAKTNRLKTRRLQVGRLRKREIYQVIQERYRREMNTLRAEISAKRKTVYAEQPFDNWKNWLQKQGKAALQVLQSHDKTDGSDYERIKSECEEVFKALRSSGYQTARKINSTIKGVMEKLEADSSQLGIESLLGDEKVELDHITKHGTALYHVGDDALRDNGFKFHISKNATQDTDIMALRIAKERFGDTLTIEGDRAFRDRMVRAAVEARLFITFSDPALEQQRRALFRKNKTQTNQTALERV